MRTSDAAGLGRVLAALAFFVVLGAPMAAFLWGTLNQALALKAPLWRLGLALPVLVLFIGLLALLSRQVQRWHAACEPLAPRREGGLHG